MRYETVIGLEVHLQLDTKSKAFCGCSTDFGNKPNSQTCPVCLGFPGSLPVLNRQAFDYSIKVGLALGCTVQPFTKFDRKHYYYPDLPKNFQISQYDLPISKDGFLEIDTEKGIKKIRIKRAHLEEDAGKLVHGEGASYVDFNRAGVPLLEIVSEPDINSPEEAYAYLTALKSLLQYLDVSDCDMEKGSLRCDANISLRPEGQVELGVKTELKNMNSFKAVKDALSFEVERQTQVLEEGGLIIQETRLWNAETSQTMIMRTKEEAKDYRYFPEPDLPPFFINKEKIDSIRATIPELPRQLAARFTKDYGLSDYDAGILTSSRRDAEYAEACIKAYPSENKKPLVNLLIGPLLSEANLRHTGISALQLSPALLCELLGFIDRQEISYLAAKTVLKEMVETGKPPAAIIKEKNLVQISDAGSLEKTVEEVLKDNDTSVQSYKSGKTNALMFLVGQVMKKSGGKANPKLVQEILKRRLDNA